MDHELKTWPGPFRALADGSKTFEYRRDDREFSVGDHLDLREWDPATGRYTGYHLGATVTYIARGPDWGIPEGYCIMALSDVCRHLEFLGESQGISSDTPSPTSNVGQTPGKHPDGP